MKAREIFEVCHARYRVMRGYLGGHVAALDWEKPSDAYHWRPERARAEEYVADFEMIGERTLRRPEWRGRQKLFRIYFVRGFEYRRAITLCGIAPGTFDYWVEEVKKACGKEFERAGLFPPGDYFRRRDMADAKGREDRKVERIERAEERVHRNEWRREENGPQREEERIEVLMGRD